MSDQWRVRFDAEVRFVNGGDLRVTGFRLDVPGERITDEELAARFVHHLGLLMVGEVRISGKTMIREAHKGGRATGDAAGTDTGTGPPGVGRSDVERRSDAGWSDAERRSDAGWSDAGQPDAERRQRSLVELSHVVRDGMVTYPGLPGPEITEYLTREESRGRYAPGTEFQIGQISMIGNTGTYLDAPAHRYADGVDLSGIPLHQVAHLPGLVVRVPAGVRAIDRLLLAPYRVAGHAVLLHTGWDAHFGTDRYGDPTHPYLTADGAASLVECGAALVGIDSVNIDDTAPAAGGARPAHSALLAAGVPIVEHLRGLDALPPVGFRFTAAPPLIAGMSGLAVRAFAVVDA